jgi:hypothetical protein
MYPSTLLQPIIKQPLYKLYNIHECTLTGPVDVHGQQGQREAVLQGRPAKVERNEEARDPAGEAISCWRGCDFSVCNELASIDKSETRAFDGETIDAIVETAVVLSSSLN